MEIGKTKIRLRIVTILIVAAAMIGSVFLFQSPSATAGFTVAPTPTPKKVKYSEFPHDTKAHKLECGTCHKFPSDNWNKIRTGEAAFPDVTEYPKHQSCVGCHKQQFFKGTPPKICSICHTNPSPGDSSRHPYPNPREIFDKSKKGKTATSDFVVGFPHDKHIEIVASYRSKSGVFRNASISRSDRRLAGEESCAVCHKTMAAQGTSEDEFVTKPPPKIGDAFWLKKGTFKTAPIGHTTCFTCHSADTGILPAPSDCAKCHHLKPPQPPADFDPKLATTMIADDKVMADAWSVRHSAGTFRHEFVAHVDLECNTCHTVTTMNTADPITLKVNISSCAICHVTSTTADGGALNDEVDKRKTAPTFQCVKCHITFGKLAVPKSHSDSISAAAGK